MPTILLLRLSERFRTGLRRSSSVPGVPSTPVRLLEERLFLQGRSLDTERGVLWPELGLLPPRGVEVPNDPFIPRGLSMVRVLEVGVTTVSTFLDLRGGENKLVRKAALPLRPPAPRSIRT